MRYKINEVKRILNISEHTLRYFDNQKIIKTVRDKNNNYRYFEENDINKIFAYKMYRSFQLPMNDALTLVSGHSVDILDSKLKSHLEYIEKEQDYLFRVKEHIILLMKKLEKWEKFKDEFEFCVSPTCYYHSNQTASNFIRTEDVCKSNYQYLSCLPDIWPCYFYNGLDQDSESALSFGYGLYTNCDAPTNDHLYLPSENCLYTMFQSEKSLEDYLPVLLSKAEEYCCIRNIKLKGTMFGNVIHEIKKEDCTTRLFDVYIPIS